MNRRSEPTTGRPLANVVTIIMVAVCTLVSAAATADQQGRIHGRVLHAGDGDRAAVGPVAIDYKLRAGDGAGFSMIEYQVAGRFEAPPVPHWHTREHFVAYVLEGELVWVLAQGEVRLAAGDTLHLPPGAPFAWSNPHDAPARFLSLWSPPGFEGFFEDLRDGILERAGPEPPAPEHMDAVVPPLWERYGIRAAGP
jgi:mannose-6-phosphate isomerase-like protein (cupin superfamily)